MAHHYTPERLAEIESEVKNMHMDSVQNLKESTSFMEVEGASFNDGGKKAVHFSHWAVVVGKMFYYHLVFDFIGKLLR